MFYGLTNLDCRQEYLYLTWRGLWVCRFLHRVFKTLSKDKIVATFIRHLKIYFLDDNYYSFVLISLKFVPISPVDNEPELVNIIV